ncbi:MAG: hypothetical protein ACLQVF_09850 [Isosphaeraceae bacterium]
MPREYFGAADGLAVSVNDDSRRTALLAMGSFIQLDFEALLTLASGHDAGLFPA